jgi:cell division protein FtsI/penicillin-binding protein 2
MGANQAFWYGFEGISMDDNALPVNSPIRNLSEEQRAIAYEEGRKAGRKAAKTQETAIKAAHDSAVEKLGGKKAAVNAAKKNAGMVVLDDGIREATMTKKQKASYQMADIVAKAVGNTIHVYHGMQEYGKYDVTCEKKHGKLDLAGAMAQSCNCAYAQIALLIGGETLGEYVDRFGIIEDMSFDGIYAVKGNFEPETDNQVALAWSAIGQHTDLINPCAWMTFMGAIGGGGSAAEPYLMERITLAGETTYQAQPQMGETVMSAELAAILTEYMRNNVTQVYGAGNFPGLTVCAKSGTSELGGGKVPNAMFSGFVADDNYPLAFIVVVENGGYGAHTCVPILSAVLAECKAVLDGN